MYRQDSGNRVQKWLSYAPLLYKHLIIYPVPSVTSINSVQWLRGVTAIKSSFKFHEGFICVSGSANRTSQTGNLQGSFSIYKCSIPQGDELDDDRLKPSIKMRSQWNFQQQIDVVQQYGNSLQNVDQNNMFAFSYKKHPVVCLISTRKLLQQGTHNQYVDTSCIKLQGHKKPITSIKWVNFQASGHKLLTSSLDCSIMQWDIEKIVLERHLVYHKQSVQAITPMYTYSNMWGSGPISTHIINSIASASTDGYVFIWDQSTATPVNKIDAKQKQLYSIDCISTYGLLTGGSDGSIRMWDLRNFKQYLYDFKVDKNYGHVGKVKELKVNRYMEQEQMNKYSSKLSLGRIKFTTSGDDGKIIEWQDKLSFVHEGHQNPATFDLNDNNNLTVSAETNKNIFMVWQSGNVLCQNQS